MKLTADELESALAWALDVARSEGWKPTRKETVNPARRECCALGAITAIGLSSYQLAHNIADDIGAHDYASGIIDGFDRSERRSGKGWSIGANLGRVFVDGAK